MSEQAQFSYPNDLERCIQFHGHVCPGLAIGYTAAKLAADKLCVGSAEDEELAAVVENDSCSVDALQVLLGCTFGKGNLIFRDWGKQVFTLFDRKNHRGVRVSFLGPMPLKKERQTLRELIDSGKATPDEKKRMAELTKEIVFTLISKADELFQVSETTEEPPPTARIVEAKKCDACGETVMLSRLETVGGESVCRGCNAKH